jgi:hypothetical protein
MFSIAFEPSLHLLPFPGMEIHCQIFFESANHSFMISASLYYNFYGRK